MQIFLIYCLFPAIPATRQQNQWDSGEYAMQLTFWVLIRNVFYRKSMLVKADRITLDVSLVKAVSFFRALPSNFTSLVFHRNWRLSLFKRRWETLRISKMNFHFMPGIFVQTSWIKIVSAASVSFLSSFQWTNFVTERLTAQTCPTNACVKHRQKFAVNSLGVSRRLNWAWSQFYALCIPI